MYYYKIADLVLATELRLQKSHDSFQISVRRIREEGLVIDACIEYQIHPADFTEFVCVTAARDLSIYEKKKENGTREWIYRNVSVAGGESTLWVSGDYRHALFYNALGENNKSFCWALNRLSQMYMECLAIRKGLLILHSACICQGNTAIAYTGISATGKSTRASHWPELFEAEWVSGDRPWVDPVAAVVYGNPWDGEHHMDGGKVHLGILLELQRSRLTALCQIPADKKLELLSSHVLVPMWDSILATKAFIAMKTLLSKVPFYRISCDCTRIAAMETYTILKNKLHLELKEVAEMKISDNFDVVALAGDYMAIPTGDRMVEFGGTVVLNEVSAFLLNHMKEDVTKEQLLALLQQEYEVTPERAAADLDMIIKKFLKIGLITR